MDYAAILVDVIAAIAAAGRDTTFETLGSAPADATRPWRGPAAPTVATSLTTRAVFVPPAGLDFGKKFIQESLLKQCEQVCLVAPSDSYDLATCTQILDAGSRWGVSWIEQLRPGDVTVLFAIGVRR